MLSREMGNKRGIANALSCLGRTVAVQGDCDTARALYEEGLALAREIDDKLGMASYLYGLADVVATQGEPARAARLWSAAEVLREAIGVPIPPAERAAYEQAVAAARTHLGEKTFAAAWTQGRTMTLEQVLGPQGRETVSKEVPSVAQPTKPQPAYPAGLSAREVEVLRLLAQGLTNPQIAQRLVISLPTVNTHVGSIYNKLGVTSRSAATRYAVEHQIV